MRKATLTLFAIAFALLVTTMPVLGDDTPGAPDPGGGTGNGVAPGVANPVPATWDHLKCYKIKDAKPFLPGPTVDLLPHEAFDTESCTIKKLRATTLCVDGSLHACMHTRPPSGQPSVQVTQPGNYAL